MEVCRGSWPLLPSCTHLIAFGVYGLLSIVNGIAMLIPRSGESVGLSQRNRALRKRKNRDSKRGMKSEWKKKRERKRRIEEHKRERRREKRWRKRLGKGWGKVKRLTALFRCLHSKLIIALFVCNLLFSLHIGKFLHFLMISFWSTSSFDGGWETACCRYERVGHLPFSFYLAASVTAILVSQSAAYIFFVFFVHELVHYRSRKHQYKVDSHFNASMKKTESSMCCSFWFEPQGVFQC